MLAVFQSAWALLLGVMLLMIGNGLSGSLMGIRGAIENFSTFEMSIITSGYFVGFLFGSRLTPVMIRKVGHVRVFAALGSFISAVLILYPTITEVWAWILLRVIFGFSFSGVYVTAESWLNNASTNETRGKALSLYMMVQMVGIVAGQALLNVADPAGFVLFVIPSVLVSLAFAPILLSATPVPTFGTTKPMSLAQLYETSPLGVTGMFLMGMIFAAQFGMASIYGAAAGMSVAEISVFISAIFLGGMAFQYPIGWLSDRIDRRILILAAAAAGAGISLVGLAFGAMSFEVLIVVGFLTGGMSNPLYALLIAYTNDYLEVDDMAAASGGLLFVNGVGAILGPILTGWVMGLIGPAGFWAYLSLTLAVVAGYAVWRMTRRASRYEGENYDATAYAPVFGTATPVAAEIAQGYYAENADRSEESGTARSVGT